MRFLIAALFVLFSVSAANAHYYAWADNDFGFKLSFPDGWKMQGGLPGDARIKVLAPGNDGAQCTIFAKKDRRFMIYPRDYMTDVVAQDIQWDYWNQAVANYDDLYFYYDNYGALGSGDARYTLVDYIDKTTKPGVRKRAWVHATLYGDLHMMTHCSSPIENFDKHAADFGQIVDSIVFEPQYTPTYNSSYRDFLKKDSYGQHWFEPIVLFFLPRKGADMIVHCTFSRKSEECLSKQKPLPTLTR
jgi:hypothetical protein